MTDQFEHSRVNEPTSDLFELLPNDKTSRSLLYLNKKIVDKKASIKKILFKTIGKGNIVRKPSPLYRLEKGFKTKFFSKNGLLIDLMPKLRSEFIQKETKIKNSLEDKIHLGEMTYLNYTDTGLDQEKQRENDLKRKMLLRSTNFLYRASPLKSHRYMNKTTTAYNEYSHSNMKINNSCAKKYDLYSPGKKHVHISPNMNYTASTFILNNSSSIGFNDKLTNNNTYSTLTNRQNKIRKQKKKVHNIKLNLLSFGKNNSNKKFIFNDDVDDTTIKNTMLDSYIKARTQKKNTIINFNKTHRPKINRKVLTNKMTDLVYNFDKLGKDLIDIIDDSKIDKKTNKFIKEDINTIFKTNDDTSELKQALSSFSNKKKEKNNMLNKNDALVDQDKFIENSLRNAAQRLSDTQAMNYIDKLMFGKVNKDQLKEEEKEEDIMRATEKFNQDNKKVKILRKKLNNNILKISKMRKQLVQKNIKLVRRIEEDLEKDKIEMSSNKL